MRDVDVAVAGDPARAARALAAEVRGPVFRLSEAFGAWRVIDRGDERVYDFAPLQGDSIEADLRRRDFTVNAMARPVAPALEAAHGDLIDPLGGRADLEAPDPARARAGGLRARSAARRCAWPRFAAELGFAPDAETERLTRERGRRAWPRPPASACSPSCAGWCIAAGALAGLAAGGPPRRPARRCCPS